MIRFWFIVVIVVLGWVASVQAAVLETNEWGNRTQLGWEYSTPTAGPINDLAPAGGCGASPSGGGTIRGSFNAGTTGSSVSGGVSRYIVPSSTIITTLFYGHWICFSTPFDFHPIGTKIHFNTNRAASGGNVNPTGKDNYVINARPGGHGVWVTTQINWDNCTYPNPNFAVEICTKNWFENRGHVELVPGRYYWLETQAIMNTTGNGFASSHDGILRAWIDDVLVIEYTDVVFRTTANNNWGDLSNSPILGGGGMTVNQVQYMYYDHNVISTTRIGRPGGTLPQDTTAPGVPALTASVSGTTAALTFTAVSDNAGGSGVASYQALSCTGASCTPSGTPALTLISPTLMGNVSGLTAGTIYGFCGRAVDAVGNASACSTPTQYITTAASTVFFNPGFFDDFNRTDGGLGANWTGGFTGNASFSIVSNQARVGSVAQDSMMHYNGTTQNNQYAKVQLVSVGGATTVAPGLLVRGQTGPAVTAYECRIVLPSTSRIAEWSAGSFANLVTNNVAAWTYQALDIPMCEAEGTALRFSVIRNNIKTLLASTTDATLASGKTGLIHFVSNTGGNTTATSQLDNFEMGGISSTPASPPSITGLTATASTITVTNGPTAPSSYRVHYGDNGGNFSYNVVHPASDFPGGVLTHSMPPGTQFLCVTPRDITGTEYPQLCLGAGFLSTILPGIDTNPATFSNPFPVADLPAGTTSTLFGAEVSKAATNCRADTTDIDYDAMDTGGTAVQMNVFNNICSVSIGGLTNGTTRTRYIASQFTNSVGATYNSTTRQAVAITVAASTPDTTPPGDVTNLVAQAIPGSTDATLTWAAAADAVVYHVYIAGGDCSVYALSGNPVTTTNTQRTLAPLTQYCFKVQGEDSSGNLSAAFSNISTIITFSVLDVNPPSDMVGLIAADSDIYVQSKLFTWTPGVDSEGAVTTGLEYCSGVGCSTWLPLGPRVSGSQLLANLTGNTFYRVRGRHYDSSGNAGGISNIAEFTTAISGLDAPRPLLPFGIERPTTVRPDVPGTPRAIRPE